MFFITIGVVLISFGGVILVGAPYLPTLTPQVQAALRLADLRPSQTLLELGCGDGKVVLAAAKRGYKVVGYELNPILALVAYLRTWRFRSQVTIYCRNFWKEQWPAADAIFVFLLPKYMNKLNKKVIQQNYKNVKVVSFAFKIPNRPIKREENGVFLYEY